MNFGLLVSHLPRQLPQSFPHSDAGSIRPDAPLAPTVQVAQSRPAARLAARWQRLKARVFAA